MSKKEFVYNHVSKWPIRWELNIKFVRANAIVNTKSLQITVSVFIFCELQPPKNQSLQVQIKIENSDQFDGRNLG